MVIPLRFVIVLSLISFSISSAGLKGAVSPSTSSRILALDAEALAGLAKQKDRTSGENAKENPSCMSDDETGLTEFVNKKTKGIGGVIKTSWSDFRVFEIRGRDNNVVMLRDSEVPTKPASEGHKFVRFVLAKAGYDTVSALGRLAAYVGVPRRAFSHAGIKDKSAVTCQEVTVMVNSGPKKLNLNKLIELEKKFPRLKVGNLEYCSEQLSLGSTNGNLFTILLRDLALTKRPKIEEACDALSKHGFINYFDHHRFGIGMQGCLPMTKVGKALLHRKWDEAVAIAMSPDGATNDAELAAKTKFAAAWAALPSAAGGSSYERGKAMRAAAAAALQALPPHCYDEIPLLTALSRGMAPPVALMRMPHRNAFIGAYWARIWNLCASARLRLYGAAKPAVGDLIRVDSSSSSSSSAGEQDHGGAGGGGGGGSRRRRQGRMTVRHVTAEDVAAGKVSMLDVVLPLPAQGVEITYPDNNVGKYMRELLDAEGVRGTVCDVKAAGAGAGAGGGAATAAAAEAPAGKAGKGKGKKGGKEEEEEGDKKDGKKKKKKGEGEPAAAAHDKGGGDGGEGGAAAAGGDGGKRGKMTERYCVFRRLLERGDGLEWEILSYASDEELRVVGDDAGGRFTVSPGGGGSGTGDGDGGGGGDAAAGRGGKEGKEGKSPAGKRKRGAAAAAAAAEQPAAKGGGVAEKIALQLRFKLAPNSSPHSLVRELTKENYTRRKLHPSPIAPAAAAPASS